jgi:glucosamine-6-phosphate isomerase
MEAKIFEDYKKLSAAGADEIVKQVQENPAAVLCFATGDTPKLTYQLIAERSKAGEVNFKDCFFIGLDEWVGISPANNGSCHWFLYHYLFEPMNINVSQIILFDAMSANLEKECKKMNETIQRLGGIDLMLVGVGMNGHIGFNEPGTSAVSLAHVVILDETTLSVGKKYFNGTVDIYKGITLGLKHFMNARKVIMMANGAKKAGIIKHTLEADITTGIPSTYIREHRNALLLVDREAFI